jgi:branched-subunit amino acid transport protein
VTWWAILAACAACYAAKVIGVSVPARVLADRRIAHAAGLLPIGLLAALVATQTFSTGRHLVLDVRAAALAVAVVAVLLRAPFLVVVVAAAATAALLRLV